MSLRVLDTDFDTFVERASPALLRLAYRLTGDRHSAEDLLQQALWRVAKRWPTAREDPDRYAYRVVVNLVTDRWRARSRKPAEVFGVQPPDRPVPALESQVDDRLALLDALQDLTSRQRAVIVLRYWEDLSVEQTARMLDTTEGNVKSTASRALDRLRAVMENQGATA